MGHNTRTAVTVGSDLRDPAETREELSDLLAYLDGLPDEVRGSGAFAAYEQRASELSRELVLAGLLLHLRPPVALTLASSARGEYERVFEHLSGLARESERSAKRSLQANRTLEWVVVAASAGGLLSALTSASSLVLPFTGVAASVAGVYAVWLSDRARS